MYRGIVVRTVRILYTDTVYTCSSSKSFSSSSSSSSSSLNLSYISTQ